MSSLLAWSLGLTGSWLPTFLLVLFTTLLVLSVFQGPPKNFPPGITILPMVGSLLSMPFGPSTEIMGNLRKKYGDLASFAIFGTRVVVVSGVKLMKEVFALQSTSIRPEFMFITVRNYMAMKNNTGDVGIIAAPDQVWKDQQRFFLRFQRGLINSNYEFAIVEEITELMNYLAKDEGRPVDVNNLFHRPVINILWRMVMGKRYPCGDPRFAKLEKNLFLPADFNLLSPMQHIPYIFKVMRHLPIKTKALKSLESITSFMKEEIKQFLANEEFRSGENFMALYIKEIEKKENPNFNMNQLEGMILDLFMGGMEPTSSTLITTVNLMAKHPHVQHRVQEELDEVVGRDRFPSFSDIEQLPYVQATIHEAQRVFSLSKFSLPHMTNQDCKLGGYDIPGGTWVLQNLDDALTNSEYWKKACVFDPQNFLDENGKYKRNNAFLPFGLGKRKCIGQHLAEIELFLFFTHLFQRFTITLLEEYKPLTCTNPMFNSPPHYTVSVTSRPK